MQALLDRAKEGGFASVRLLQAAYNMESFSLYHRLGFDVKDALASIRGRPPADEPVEGTIRLYTPNDAEVCDALHRDVFPAHQTHFQQALAEAASRSEAHDASGLTNFQFAQAQRIHRFSLTMTWQALLAARFKCVPATSNKTSPRLLRARSPSELPSVTSLASRNSPSISSSMLATS